MDEKDQPGIRFLGVHLLELHFELKDAPGERLPTGIKFGVQAELYNDDKKLDIRLDVDVFGAMKDGAQVPPIEFRFALRGSFEATEACKMPLRDFAEDHGPITLPENWTRS